MLNFNKRLEAILKKPLKEWLEPGIDHHLERHGGAGVDQRTYADLVPQINDKYIGIIDTAIATISRYLKHVGYGNNDRQIEEQEVLTRLDNILITLNRLEERLQQAIKEFEFNDDEDADDGETSKMRHQDLTLLMNVSSSALRIINADLKFVKENAAKNKLRIDPKIFNSIYDLYPIMSDYEKIITYFAQYIYEITADEELLETPERKWLPTVPPQRIQQIVAENPEHGVDEALTKISQIMNYGPDYHAAGEMLALICHHWNVTSKSLKDELITLSRTFRSGYDEEGAATEVINFIDREGHKYGIK